jgi:hypothetical protein
MERYDAIVIGSGLVDSAIAFGLTRVRSARRARG